MFAAPNYRDLTTLATRLLVAVMVCATLIGLDLAARPAPNPPARASWPASDKDFSNAPQLIGKGHIPMPFQTPAAHSSSLLPMPAHHTDALLAFWFAGSRESGQDVGIAASGFERATGQWRPAQFVVERHALARQLGIGVRRLGNPVAWLDAQSRVHLFVVATGLGGWAASRVVHLRHQFMPNAPLAQSGKALATMNFDVAEMLPLAWGFNTSFLVRTAPMPLQDGGMLLPVHFELGLKYPLALRFDAQGDFKGMTHISARRHALQPTLLAQSTTHWLALMRDQRRDGRIMAAQTQDGGQSWQDLPDLALTNPDASVAGLALAPGQLWLAHNSSVGSRNVLDLSHSVDGQAWQTRQQIQTGSGKDEFSYPALAWADDSLWVSYTDQRQRIAWQRLAWPRHQGLVHE